MKKYDKMLLILSLPLILAACNGSHGDSTSGANLSDLSLSSDQSGQDSSGHESGSISETSYSSIDYTIGWSQDVLDVMVPHLGGHAVPFIDLPGRVFAYWMTDTSYYATTPDYLSIYSNGAFDNELVVEAKFTYLKAGWDVEYDRENQSLHAEELTLGIKLDFYGVTDSSNNFTSPQIDIYYNEPFIIPTDGAWRTGTLSALAGVGITDDHMLPYTYLGTLAEETSTVSGYSNTIEIKGLKGGWTTYKNEIINAAKSVFSRSRKWSQSTETITVGSGYYAETYQGTSFTKTFGDGYRLKAVLYGLDTSTSYYNTEETPVLRVTCYSPSN